MKTLHDPGAAAALIRRASTLRSDSVRGWGKMSIDQMLWHVNAALETALGTRVLPSERRPLPRFLFKWMVLNGPWPKGRTPTAKGLIARSTYSFQEQIGRLPRLIEAVADRPLQAPWPVHGTIGVMTGREWSQLQWRHIDYHLRQFGA